MAYISCSFHTERITGSPPGNVLSASMVSLSKSICKVLIHSRSSVCAICRVTRLRVAGFFFWVAIVQRYKLAGYLRGTCGGQNTILLASTICPIGYNNAYLMAYHTCWGIITLWNICVEQIAKSRELGVMATISLIEYYEFVIACKYYCNLKTSLCMNFFCVSQPCIF